MKKILLVDDSASIRMVLKSVLFSKYELLEASDGQSGLSKATVSDVDLFLLDINMPGMNGIEMVKELRKKEKYARTPIIMLTTECSDQIKKEGKEAGANGWITKPCEPVKLLSALEKFIG